MYNKIVTEAHIGNVTYIITSECSPVATESVEKKLERLILRHVSDKDSYQKNADLPLAMRADKSEYVAYQ